MNPEDPRVTKQARLLLHVQRRLAGLPLIAAGAAIMLVAALLISIAVVFVKDSILPTIFTLVAGHPVNVLLVASGAIVIAVFLMASGDLFHEKLISVLPSFADKKAALRIALARPTSGRIPACRRNRRARSGARR